MHCRFIQQCRSACDERVVSVLTSRRLCDHCLYLPVCHSVETDVDQTWGRGDPVEVVVIPDSFFIFSPLLNMVFLDMSITHTVNGLVLQYSAK